MFEEVSGTGMLWALVIFFFTQVSFFYFLKKKWQNENKRRYDHSQWMVA